MKISIVLGTRPEIIKFSPVVRECDRVGLDYFILHTGQHYSFDMDRVFFEQLELPEAKYNLNVGSGSHAEQTGKMLFGIEKVLQNEKPDVVLVEGDTNSVLSGALAAIKLGMKVGHVEAGLRSYDDKMPEEINRVLADRCSHLLFAPTENSKRILLGEGIAEEKIFVTGNTIVDAVSQNLQICRQKESVQSKLCIDAKRYFLVTVHRQENVDNVKRLRDIMIGLEVIHEEFDLPVIWPMHPRAKKQLEAFQIRMSGIEIIEPLDYLSFLQLENEAKLVLTDSGGVQEETCVLHVPCVTLRDNTERPETLQTGSNILAGTNPQRMLECTKTMVTKANAWENPFGDGKSAERIVKITRKHE